MVGRRFIKKELDALRIDRSATAVRRPVRWGWAAAAALLLIVVGAASLWWLGPSRAAEVRTFAVREQGIASGGGATVLNASGYVTARRRATVASKITGRLVAVLVEEGVGVDKGQVLARLDDSTQRAGLALAESRLEAAVRAIGQTRAQLDLARLTLHRTRRLVDSGIVGQEQLDESRTGVATLEAHLAVEEQ